MNEFFEGLDGAAPDEGFDLLPEIFHLEDQLAASPTTPTTTTRMTDGS